MTRSVIDCYGMNSRLTFDPQIVRQAPAALNRSHILASTSQALDAQTTGTRSSRRRWPRARASHSRQEYDTLDVVGCLLVDMGQSVVACASRTVRPFRGRERPMSDHQIIAITRAHIWMAEQRTPRTHGHAVGDERRICEVDVLDSASRDTVHDGDNTASTS